MTYDDDDDNNDLMRGERIEFDGKSYTMRGWSEVLGIPYKTLEYRIKVLKWPLRQALSKEKRPHPPKRTLTVQTDSGPVSKTMSEWSRDRNINIATISLRLRRGWTVEEALNFKPRNVDTE